jgi:hypothetical protein
MNTQLKNIFIKKEQQLEISGILALPTLRSIRLEVRANPLR